jgi:hypothetical protein
MSFEGVVSSSIDAIIGVWTASKRCNPNYKLANQKIHGVLCVQDAAHSIATMIGGINSIVGVMESCFPGFKDPRGAGTCVSAASELVSLSAGLVSTSAAIANDCSGSYASPAILGGASNLGLCLGDVTTATDSLLKGAVMIGSVFDKTKHCLGDSCQEKYDALASALAMFGSGLAAAFNDCSTDIDGNGGKGNQDAACAGDVLALVSSIGGTVEHAYELSKVCTKPASYYDATVVGSDLKLSNNKFMMLAFAAALPITAFASFFGGMRVAKSRSARATSSYEKPAEELTAFD